MKIVQIASDVYPIPPKKYGGAERLVHTLTEALVRKGHQVYLFAPEGSVTSAELIPYEHEGHNKEKIVDFVRRKLPERIDIIHDHVRYIGEEQSETLPASVVCTLHYSYRNDSIQNPVYVSKKSRELCGNRGFYVYNGINPEEYQFNDQKGNYLLFMGQVEWHKGIHFAIEVAERTNLPLVIAGPVFNDGFFSEHIAPKIRSNPNIWYVGEVGGQDRLDLFKHARCFLFPTNWEEPFGLVMIEAMACGTPVLAFGNGAVPEVLSGHSELICQDTKEMIEKVQHHSFPSPQSLRDYVIQNYSDSMMVDRYLEIYEQVRKKS